MSDQEDLHRPTAAGPDPDAGAVSAAEAAEATQEQAIAGAPDPDEPLAEAPHAAAYEPAGAPPAPGFIDDPEHPEKAVGAAFAGGLVAALFLKALARRRHR